MSLQAPKPLSSQVESVPLHCDREHLPGGSVPWLHTGRGHSRMLSASWYGDSQWEGCRWPGSLRDWYQDLTVIHGDPHIIIDFLWSQCHEIPRADSMFVPSQWEMELLCNNVSHWLGESLESDQACTPLWSSPAIYTYYRHAYQGPLLLTENT